ncbi:MAG TPA: NAD(P)H-dependent oxidoreductase subunit E [Bacteroidales bacterium]|nr:NAD(P)H-dependent oxidoreductase subunit E [Bacteroidales bacterium]
MSQTDIKNIVEKLKANGVGDVIKVLQSVQVQLGYIKYEHIKDIANLLKMPESKVFGIATYYSQFRFKPIAKYHIKICNGTSCHVNDKYYLLEEIERWIKLKNSDKKNNQYSYEIVDCLGVCAFSPALAVNDKIFTKVDMIKLKKILNMIENDNLEIELL